MEQLYCSGILFGNTSERDQRCRMVQERDQHPYICSRAARNGQPWEDSRCGFCISERHLHRDNILPVPSEMVHRSEEHTSELQSRENLVCRLLLEKKKYN